jgi:hypothetical protein
MTRVIPLISMALMSVLAAAEGPFDVADWIDRWATENQSYVTKQVRDEAPEIRGPNLNLLSFWIVKYPTIRLMVHPSPPVDYKILINSEDCPPTPSGLYKVPIGTAEVEVERMGRPPCRWRSMLEAAHTYDVSCNL